ncbi:heme-binding protein [Pirellula staleyi DSM 6068]|uniref:Heme-binding protein n=1 Tax=Pirellula staleyi (strain ATCC 27377 / DSM 6068 / ICPB 4128) TaxID=530564 RepID=D2R0K4_PIRSD|nr:c-type cytochrome [Pirellula staleyi]ADB16602.1 heme-binding protein [Pirellula staleyi DSM 6068]
MLRACLLSLAALATLVLASPVSAQEKPLWLWTSAGAKDGEKAYFRTTFELADAPKSASYIGSCDNSFTLLVNGQELKKHDGWESRLKVDIAKQLRKGKNVVAVIGQNESGIAALHGEILIENADGTKQRLVSNKSWKCSTEAPAGWQMPTFDDSAWKAPHSFGPMGVGPWGDLTGSTAGGSTPVEAMKPLPGFEVELVYSVPKGEQGSWVSMASKPDGTLVVCDQGGSLYSVTPGKTAETTKVEKIDVPIGQAQGLLWANDRLYVVVNGSAAQGSGLYEVTDTNADGQLDKVTLLKKLNGGGEHGPHAVRLGPDGKLYVIAGNFTAVPEGYDPSSPMRNWAEDLLLPRNPDGGGHDPHIMAPGGWIARCDLKGQNWELLSAGLRNAYDFDFNPEGQVFTYDSDMEWDTGTPWYRPTRVNHLVSGGEYGWRNGTGKWPEYSPDSLGAVVNIGMGSPTGVAFGTGAKFPEKYQRALFINDWTYGKLYAVHLAPVGATYTATFEVFVEGRPMPLTDVVIHTDGQMYFTIGGRGTQSGLYRVKYVGSESTAPAAPAADAAAAAARKLRSEIEAFQTKEDPQAVDFCWPHMNSGDRAIRYAARVAIEHQPIAAWKEKAFAETRVTAAINAMIAVARSGDKSMLPQLVEKLGSLPTSRMTEDQLLALSRAYGLAFIRLGKPDAATAKSIADKLLPLFPNQSESVNRELAALLVYLESPAVIEPALKLLSAAQTQEEQLYYVLVLRNISPLLTMEQRKVFFSWISMGQQKGRGGNSFRKFLDRIRTDAAEKLTEADRLALKEVIEGKAFVETVKLETTRQFVHNWQAEDFAASLGDVEKGRSFEKGRAAYEAAQCYKCHRFDGQGGDTGPDITGVGNRFNTQYLVESLVVPSKAISDQYVGSMILTVDGDVITGRVIEENDKVIKVRTDPFALQLVTIAKEDIEQRQQSKISEMPQGLINTLTKEEVLDLIAYLRSGGKKDDKAFQP